MKQNYYTAEEAMAVLEPRIREMFKDREEAEEQIDVNVNANVN